MAAASAEMAPRVHSVAATRSLPSSSILSSSPSTPKAPVLKPQLRVKPNSFSLTALTTIFLLALFSLPHEANAVSLAENQVPSSFTEDKAYHQIQEILSSLKKIAEDFYGKRSVVKPAGEQALKPASPADTEASTKAQEANQSFGIDTEPVLSANKTVAEIAQQIIKVIEETVETISFSDPIVIVGAAAAAFLVYLLIRPIWSAISFKLPTNGADEASFLGYKGDLSPAQTLDLLLSTNHYLIDIRSEKDKDKHGIPSLPSSAKKKMIAIPLEELPSNLRGIIRNTKKVEAEIAALKISYLTKINKGSSIVIMDSYSDFAKKVARTLTRLGFKNCYIVADRFSGGRGWLHSRDDLAERMGFGADLGKI